MNVRIKKGDRVKVISGKDRSKTGRVLRVFPKERRALIEGVNLRKKHQRPRTRDGKGEVITLPHPIHISNLMVICPACAKPTRIGMRSSGEQNMKERVCKKCNALIK